MKNLLLPTVVLLLWAKKGSTLNCYQCENCTTVNDVLSLSCSVEFNDICVTTIQLDGRITRNCGSFTGSYPTNSCRWNGGRYMCTCTTDSCNDRDTTALTESTQKCYECKNCDKVMESQLVSCPWFMDACVVKKNSTGVIERKCDFFHHNDTLQTSCPSATVDSRCTCTKDRCNAANYTKTNLTGSTLACYECVNCNTTNYDHARTCSTDSNDICMTIIQLDGQITRSCGFITGNYPTNSCRWYNGKYTCTCTTDLCNGNKSTAFTENKRTCYECNDCDMVIESQLVSCPWPMDACTTKETSTGAIQRGCDFFNYDDSSQKMCPSSSLVSTCKCTQDRCNGAKVVRPTSKLECYQCDNCTDVKDARVRACPPTSEDVCLTTIELDGTTKRSCGDITGNYPTNSCRWYSEKYTCACTTDLCNQENAKLITETTQKCYECVGCDKVSKDQLVSCPWYKDACFMKKSFFGAIERGCDLFRHDDTDMGTCELANIGKTCKCTQGGCNGDAAVRFSVASQMLTISIAILGIL